MGFQALRIALASQHSISSGCCARLRATCHSGMSFQGITKKLIYENLLSGKHYYHHLCKKHVSSFHTLKTVSQNIFLSKLSSRLLKEIDKPGSIIHLNSCVASYSCHHQNQLFQKTTKLTESTDISGNRYHQPKVEPDWQYLLNPENVQEIEENIKHRKGIGNIKRLHELYDAYKDAMNQGSEDASCLNENLIREAMMIPNRTHPQVPIGDETHNRVLEMHGTQKEFNFKPKTAHQLGESLGMLRIGNVGHTTGARTYYFLGGLAQLEQALISFATDHLLQHGFTLMAVPDLLHPRVIDGCGFNTSGDRSQVYRLDPSRHGEVCLSGTGEMALGGFYSNQCLHMDEMPQKVAAISRCFRAETSNVEKKAGIYRVHQFSKVEMFGVTLNETGEESTDLLQHFVDIETGLYNKLGLPFRVMEMSTQELGAPAHRKFDMEAWMPGCDMWGEISSSSDCSDFQSRRLNIQYFTDTGDSKYCHTVNGTAVAVPRLIMAILENYQQKDGTVDLPASLQPYMGGMQRLQPDHRLVAKWIKLTRNLKKQSKIS